MMKSRHAFTILELSIVLVIIGLLVGGVLAGRGLLKSASMRAVMTEASTYLAATNQFKTQYRYWPGDMPTATQYWSTSSNGNGNGIVTYSGAAAAFSEAFTFWQQLALAQFIEGNYSGKAGAGGVADHVFGTNSPRSKYSGGAVQQGGGSSTAVGWSSTYTDQSAGGDTRFFAYNYLNWLTIGGGSTTYADDLFLKTEEASMIDVKMDDGTPGTGKVVAWPLTECTNASGVSDYTATYKLSNTADYQCALFFKY